MDEYERYIKSIKKYERITKDQEKDVSRIIQSSEDQKEVDKATKELVEANLFLVVSRALKIRKKFKYSVLMDLIAEGNTALIRASSKYDVSRDDSSSFSTFATILIDQHIYTYIQNDRLVHIPSHHPLFLSKIKKLEEEHGDELTDEIIMKELEISSRFLKYLRNETHYRTISLEEVNVPTYEEGSSWAETIADDKAVDPSKETNIMTLRKHLDKYMGNLSKREQIIIESMFYGNERMTLDAVALKVGVSKERVRQISVKSLAYLRGCLEREYSKEQPEKKKQIEIKQAKKAPPIKLYKKYVNSRLTFVDVLGMEQKYEELERVRLEERAEIEREERERVKNTLPETEKREKEANEKMHKILDYYCDL